MSVLCSSRPQKMPKWPVIIFWYWLTWIACKRAVKTVLVDFCKLHYSIYFTVLLHRKWRYVTSV